MGIESEIAWTDSTWNCWQGCTRTSPGCAHCYMYTTKHRYGQDPSVVIRSAKATFYAPLRWKEPRKIFTCSWSDFFHQGVDAWRSEAWDIIRATPRHTYQILTKRPERIGQCLPPDWGEGWPHVWLGVTVENTDYRCRIDLLRQIPAHIRFLSLEPLLGPIPNLDLSNIHWVIVGGESGPHFRPCEAAWVRDIRDQCIAAKVPFFFKQWGGRTPRAGGRMLDGRTWDEFPGQINDDGGKMETQEVGKLGDGMVPKAEDMNQKKLKKISEWLKGLDSHTIYAHESLAQEFKTETGHVACWPCRTGKQLRAYMADCRRWGNFWTESDDETLANGWEIAEALCQAYAGSVEYRRPHGRGSRFDAALAALKVAGL